MLADVYINEVWILLMFLIGAAVVIPALLIGVKQLQKSEQARWIAGGLLVLMAAFTVASGGTVVLGLIVLIVVPALAWLIHMLMVSTKTRNVTMMVALVAGGGFLIALTLMKVRNEEMQTAISYELQENILQEQAVMLRLQRVQEEQQRRELFDSQYNASRAAPADSGSNESTDAASLNNGIHVLANGPGVAWFPEVDERFEAELQPSMSSAAQAIGRKLIPLIEHVTEQKVDPPVIQIHVGPTLRLERDARRALDALADVIRKQYPDAKVLAELLSPGNSITELDPNAISILLDMSVVQRLNEAAWDKSRNELMADFKAEVKGKRSSANVSLRMVEKPWVSDMDWYRSTRNNRGMMIDGRSRNLATSSEEAADAALEDAVVLLTPVAMKLLESLGEPLIRTPSAGEVADQLRWKMTNGNLIADRFSQRLVHPQGNFWREAILVNADFYNMYEVVNGWIQQRQQEERQHLSLGFTLILLLIGVVLLHSIMNWLTKGYHRTRISLMSGLLFGSGLLATLIVMWNT